jgi:hypothetical protein
LCKKRGFFDARGRFVDKDCLLVGGLGFIQKLYVAYRMMLACAWGVRNGRKLNFWRTLKLAG